jgi:hypothetical protein
MKTALRALSLFLGASWTIGSAAFAADWDTVQTILGRKGDVDQGVLRVTFPRSDLHVTLGDVPVSAELVFDSWYGFWPMSDGTTMLMGDTCIREEELPAVEKEIHEQGLDLTALHNHLVGETPKIMFLHLSGRGTAEALAREVKSVLARTTTRTDEEHQESQKSAPDWTAVTAVLGEPAEKEGDIVEYGFRRSESLSMRGQSLPSTDALETAPEVKFQMLKDGRTITYGEMILTADEVGPVFHALVAHGITITALHNHMTEESPRLFFMHWWAVGAPRDLAEGVRAAIQPLHLRTEHDSHG